MAEQRRRGISGSAWTPKLKREAALTALTAVGLLIGLLGSALAEGQLAAFGYLLAYLAGGLPLSVSVGRAALRGRIDIDLLMLLAALAAAAVGEARDGAILLLLFSLAETLESYAMGRTRRAVESLLELRPEVALRRDGDRLVPVPVEELRPGDVAVIRPGERIPADGTVLVGASATDESMLTGESMPVDKEPGSRVFAGTVNSHGALEVRVDKEAQESTLARMIELVTEAQKDRSRGQRFGDWFGRRYTVVVLLGSIVALLAFMGLGWDTADALYRTATILVVASPCAVVISVPAATLSALAAAARRGVLFKGGAALEALAATDIVALDKTGTLTEGRPAVSRLVPVRVDERQLLETAAALEATSEHPIGRAVVAAAEARGIVPAPRPNARTMPGQGIVAPSGNGFVWAGTRRLAKEMGVVLEPGEEERLRALESLGGSVVLIGDRELLGFMAVSDPVRDQAVGLVATLRRLGVERVVMLTGDHRESALAVASQVGIPEQDVHAGLLPEDKLRLVKELREKGRTVFIGDGVNDAAALVTADVGVAMGGAGSDVALESADVVLLSDNLARLEDAFMLSRRSNLVVRQNLVFAISVMLVLLVIALFGELPLPLAVIGHEGGTILVVLNGLRLLAGPGRLGRRMRRGPRPAEPKRAGALS